MGDLSISPAYNQSTAPLTTEEPATWVSPQSEIASTDHSTQSFPPELVDPGNREEAPSIASYLRSGRDHAMKHGKDFGVGLSKGGVELIESVGGLAKGVWGVTGLWLVDPKQANQNVRSMESTARSAIKTVYLASELGKLHGEEAHLQARDDLYNTGKAFVTEVARPYQEAIEEGRPAEAVGRAAFEALGLVVGAKGLEKLGKSKFARQALDKLGDVATDATKATKKRVVQLAKDQTGAVGTPPSKWVKKVNGRYPKNYQYAGKVYKLPGKLGKKYPDGVRFKRNGFPDFSPYSVRSVDVENLVGKIEPDFAAANRKVGIAELPEDYTWHHVENGRTMQMVPRDLHKNVGHTGGAAFLRELAKN